MQDTFRLDYYYRSVAAQMIQELGDTLMLLAQRAERQDAHGASAAVAEAATELLDVGCTIAPEHNAAIADIAVA